MKIAINSLPRCGTKMLQANFHRYIKSAGYNVLCPNSFDGILEPFNFPDHELELQVTMTGIDYIDDDKIHFKKKHSTPLNLNTAIINRYQYLMSLKDKSWVYKRTPWRRFDPILYESAVELDKCVSVIRTDFFDHALSFALAKQLDIWAPTIELEEAIKKYTNQQIKVNETDFVSAYKWIKGYSTIRWVDNIQVVNFHEMVKIKNSKEFCEFFQIPFVEFDFHQFVIEYGDNKRKMVSNLKQLRLSAAIIDDKFKGYSDV
jgi:hypothetical protein